MKKLLIVCALFSSAAFADLGIWTRCVGQGDGNTGSWATTVVLDAVLTKSSLQEASFFMNPNVFAKPVEVEGKSYQKAYIVEKPEFPQDAYEPENPRFKGLSQFIVQTAEEGFAKEEIMSNLELIDIEAHVLNYETVLAKLKEKAKTSDRFTIEWGDVEGFTRLDHSNNDGGFDYIFMTCNFYQRKSNLK